MVPYCVRATTSERVFALSPVGLQQHAVDLLEVDAAGFEQSSEKTTPPDTRWMVPAVGAMVGSP
jgi:hypothetical protein